MTDTINTLADPGSDPAHEWQQPAFTADEYRTAAKVLAASWNQRGFPYSARTAGEYCEDQATRLEAESARDEYVEKLADVLAVAEGGAHLDQLQGWRQTGLRDGIRAVLDHLAADGRLLPEGGTVLDADEFDKVRELAEAAMGVEDLELVGKAAYVAGLLNAIEDAAITPPAVSVPDSGEPELCPSTHRYFTCTRELGHEGKHEANDGRIVARSWPAEDVPDCGPDGTPEKPWTRVEEIGEGTWFRPKSMPGVHLSKSGRTGWFVMKDEANQLPPSPRTMNDLAPFVRVDGDKA
ncbi:hypothetical protein GS860_16065 [Rhodococcus hoagii]|nr:hypothetical protein [Prescottella equi]